MERGPFIIKADGTTDNWDPRKLMRSLKAAGAPEDLAASVIAHVERDMTDGMRTRDIYRHAYALLKKAHRPFAARYSLKKALFELGPSGFPFERYVARLLESEGYRTSVGTMVRGKCVVHETDVIAEKDDERIIVEAKYHNTPEVKTDVKVALYVHARFQDIAARLEHEDRTSGNGEHYHRAWLITNTSFTGQAIAYGTCAGLNMTGWNHPHGRTLQDLVEAAQAHPLTCLTTLSGGEKRGLLEKGVVLCQDIMRDPGLLSASGLSSAKRSSVLSEGAELCTIN